MKGWVAFDKSVGPVKGKLFLTVPQRRFVCQTKRQHV
jgi:hypothetical protein